MRRASYRTSEGAHSGLFTAEAGPTDTPRALSGTGFSRSTDTPRALSGTGFSRECVRRHTANLMANTPASSRLKPVLLRQCVRLVGLALAGNASASYRTSEGEHPGLFPAEAGPTDTQRALSGTGFSRECVRRHTGNLMANTPASSRLKPVPLIHRVRLVGPALAGNASGVIPHI
jgi:hypothetical protein